MNLLNLAHSRELLEKYPFFSLVEPSGGVIHGLYHLVQEDYSGPAFTTVVAGVGNITAAFPSVLSQSGADIANSRLGGAGADEKVELALVRAVAEAAERYASCVLPEEGRIISASAEDLGESALEFADLLRCSDKEYEHPRCNLRPFERNKAVRWIEGYSLTERKPKFVPLVMSHLYIREWETERFWNPISTGVATHTDPVKAAVTAINKVVERDAIALVWLLKIPLPKLVFDEPVPESLSVKFGRLSRSKVKQMFFDATLDVGVPTVYGLQLTDGHPKISQFVNCSSGLSAWENCGKIIRESACGRIAVSQAPEAPEDFSAFTSLEHGAAYMGTPERRRCFEFLTETPHARAISECKSTYPSGNSKLELEYLVATFVAWGMDVVLIDLTTDELRAVGLHVVRAVIPGLAPMSCIYRSRFLGHPRIYQFSKDHGLEVASEEELNPMPQPFA